MPCCITESYDTNTSTSWPWMSVSNGVSTSAGSLDDGPELWMDLYEIKNRVTEGGFQYAPIFNPYVL
jgi:hypothetical protein